MRSRLNQNNISKNGIGFNIKKQHQSKQRSHHKKQHSSKHKKHSGQKHRSHGAKHSRRSIHHPKQNKKK